jgi:tetratricopeptide (TPR) repeat protein
VYVAVVRPELAEGAPSELADVLRLSIAAEVCRCRSTYTLRAADIDAVKGDSKMIAQVLGVDEIVYTRLSPSAAGFSVELSREIVSFDEKGVFKSDTHTITFPAPDAPRPLVGVIRDYLSSLYSNRQRVFSGSPKGDYITLARVWGKVGRPGTDYDELLAELAKLRESGNAPTEAYQVEASISRYMYQVTNDDRYIARARDVLKRAPDDPSILLTAVEVEQAAGKQERALKLLEEAEEKIPDDPYLWSSEAKAHEDANIEKALLAVSQARETVFSLHALSRLETRVGLYEEARQNLDKALSYVQEARSDDLLLKESLAHLEMTAGNLELAENQYRELVRVEPGNHFNHINLAAIQLLLGRYQSAAERLEFLAGSGFTLPVTFLNLGDAYSLLGDNRRAGKAYLRVIEVSEWSSSPRDIGYRAQALAHLGKKEEALETINKALELANIPENIYSSSVVNVILGNREKAKELAREAVGRGMGAHWFNLPWFDGMGIADYADGRTDERLSNQTKAVQLRDHPTNFSRIKEGCSIIFWLLAKGDVGSAAKEVHAILSEVETKAIRYLRLAVMFSILLALSVSLTILLVVFLKRKGKEKERLAGTRISEIKERLEDALGDKRILEQFRDFASFEISSINETFPAANVALNRGALQVRSGNLNSGLEYLQEAIDGFSEMREVLSALVKATARRDEPSGQDT